jgi:S1-C subfamily serine protease
LRYGWAVRRIEVSEDPFTTKRWRIHSTPTTLLVRDGREVDRILGPVTFDELQRRMMAASSRIAGNNSTATAAVPPNPGIVPTATSFSLQPITKQVDSQPMSFEPEPLSPPGNNQALGNPAFFVNQTQDRGADSADASEIARRATVRIRIEEPNTQAFGTGTIIHTHQEDALIITCGHLFRGVGPNPSITVELFDGGQAIAYPASLVHYEAGDKDIGLIAFRPGHPVACAPIATSKRLAEGDYVFSLGCDHGNDPSRRNSRVTKLNRYLGPPNIEVAGMPVQGRSGGGLFTQAGELIGICYAADQELDEGLYAGLEVIHEQVAKLGLESLLQPAAMIPQSALADHSKDRPLNNNRSGNNPSGNNRSNSNLSHSGPANTDLADTRRTNTGRGGFGRTNENASKSITLIVRDGDGSQREMQIQDPSPALLQALAREGYAIAR